MIGIKAKLRYSELLAARTYLKQLINEEIEEDNKIILNDILIDLDELFLQQISFIANEVDMNYPAN